MEIDTRPHLRDDPMGDCRSFGSNYHPSSQSRKISIGIMVDSLAKEKLGATKEDEVAVPSAERVNSNGGNSVDGKTMGGGVTAAIKGKQTEAPEQVSSPWINTRSFHHETPASENVLPAKQTSIPATGGRKNKINGIKNAPATYSVQFFANQTSILQSDDNKLKKFDGITYRRKGRQDGNSERVEEFTFATPQENLVSQKVVIEEKSETRTETLKMKLWEILGTVSSPKSQNSSSQAREGGADKLKPEQIVGQKGDTDVKRRQNSDTIETDSESPAHTIKRPITRSLTRKIAPTKGQPKKSKVGPSFNYKQKHQEKNIFTSEEVWSGRVDGAVSRGSSMSAWKRSQRKSSTIEPCKICFTEKENADEIQRATYRSETPPPAEKTSSFANKMGGFHGCRSENKKEYINLKSKIQEEDSHQSPMTKADQQGDFHSPVLPENMDQQEGIGNPSFENVVNPQNDLKSPTFRINTPISNSSGSPTPKTDQMEQGVCSPLAERKFTVGNIRSFKTLQTSKPDSCGSHAQNESSDDAEELKDSPPRNPVPVKESEDAEDGLSESSSEEGDSEIFEEGSPIIKGRRERETSPEIATAVKPKFMLCPTKRLRNQEGIGINEFSPTLPSPKGMGESDWIHEPSEQNQENELTRVVTLFALALENFKSKMTLATRKKSSEILISASEGIHLQLQNVQSQIQTDVGKLTSVGKSKRKRLESKFQEQQEQLKLIQEKFKEELQQHLQDCRNILEGLEGHRIELKATVKKQKASHQKLLLQVEESVETQLNDAQRRIKAVNELAREKMIQLKHLIAECLKEGILN